MNNAIKFDKSQRRVFIDSALGCPGGCRYCYLPDFGATATPVTYNFSGEDVAQTLYANKQFVAGRHGTLISFGHMSDPFLAPVILKTLDYLEHVLSLGNPVQLASKCFGANKQTATAIAKWQQYDGQFMLNVSIPSLQHAAQLEPHTPPPAHRLRVMRDFIASDLATSLIIKPIIPGVTETEIDLFVEAIEMYQITHCIVGALYAGERILTSLNNVWENHIPLAGEVVDLQPTDDRLHFPNDTRQTLGSMTPLSIQQQIVDQLVARTQAMIFKTSSCALAQRLAIADPMLTWRRTPELCVQCQDCESLEQHQGIR